MNRPTDITLQQYLRKHLVFLGLSIIVVYSYAMYILYSWGLDDSSEFYLYQDARMAVTLLQQGQPLPSNTLNRKFFLGHHQLSQQYQGIIPISSDTPVITHFESEHWFDYILSYPIPKPDILGMPDTVQDTMLFVIHTFDTTEDANVPGLSILESTIIVSTIALLLILLSATHIYRTIIYPINRLYQWAATLENNKSPSQMNIIPVHSLRFSELKIVGLRLQESINRIISLAEREKSFVRCLSHELRTPMAIVSAALDILDNKNIEKGIRSKIVRIRQANNSMVSISDTLLQIWREQQKQGLSVSTEKINTRALVNTIINDNLHVQAEPNLSIDNSIPETHTVNLEKQSLSIVITNLIKNALQYAHQGKITIIVNTNSLTVSNVYSGATKHTNQESDFGFGLGLYIAETVATQQGWLLACKQENNEFCSTLTFIPKTAKQSPNR